MYLSSGLAFAEPMSDTHARNRLKDGTCRRLIGLMPSAGAGNPPVRTASRTAAHEHELGTCSRNVLRKKNVLRKRAQKKKKGA